MQFFSKTISRIILFLIIAAFLITVGINLVIYFSGARERLTQQAELLLGRPVSIGRIYFNPFTGLYIQNISCPAQKLFIQLSSISLRLFPLFKTITSRQDWHDQIKIKKISINHHLILSHFKAEVNRTKESYSVPNFTSKVADGKLQGALIFPPSQSSEPTYYFSAKFTNVSLKEFFKKNDFQKNIISGSAQGDISFTGIMNKPETIQGAGMLNILQGQFKPADFLYQVGQLLQIEELQILKLSEAKVNYSIANSHLLINSARMTSDNLMLTANGTCSFNGSLNLNAALLLNEKLQGRLERIVPNQLLSLVDNGYIKIPFNIYGSTDHPQTDLLSKIGAQQLQNSLGSLIKGFLR